MSLLALGLDSPLLFRLWCIVLEARVLVMSRVTGATLPRLEPLRCSLTSLCPKNMAVTALRAALRVLPCWDPQVTGVTVIIPMLVVDFKP